ncbi:MAG: hypothetical protein CO056_02425 [Candidatus Tagabacteria bacterium CG_4_9_14_0_2_um_filter_41_11]|uniref:Aspartate aminotransferase family protein n=2 Tax=Candidatus Tagaibacteriota TaxID=1817918 RepID=A0A2M7B9H4_9BACT|nr:MAG: hypothetical protein COS58_00695 [Candidatus Tagabacteria bacterium CG03_land_8_20_14_0_80_41_22]PJC25063.1 MAG: hypothetical protein CO056_02425 [Candidatus Tagabacteria bacterium CG_4_9_14_0_2_um_filter_41_11]
MSKKRTKEEYFAKEKELIGTSTVDFDGPVIIGGKGIVGYDLNGKEFLDFTGQISLLNTGYGPKEVVSAICQQAKSGVHSCISADYPFLNEITINRRKLEVSRVALAEKLIEITDKVMPFKKRVYFEDSGATAVDLAGKIAEITHIRNRGIGTESLQRHFESDIFIPSEFELFKFSFLVFRNAFHGRHGLAQLFTNSKPKQMWAVSSSCVVGRLPFPTPGINGWKFSRTVKSAEEHISKFAPILAFIFEPVQGEGGINVPDGALLKELAGYLREKGIYIIADEIQAGLGRTGKMWACEHFGIEPDMLITSKSFSAGIGGVSAVIVNDDKFKDLEPGMHSGSHHASPIPVAAAIANIDLILRKNLVEQSANHGAYLLRRLEAIKEKRPSLISDVRGLGLMIGIEFQTAEIRDAVAKECKMNGLLLAPCGQKVIRMTPPLIVTIEEIDKALDIFENVLNYFLGKP